MLAHELHGQVHAHAARFARAREGPAGPVLDNLGEAVGHMAAEVRALGASIAGIGPLLGAESLEAAVGPPGVPGDARRIGELATAIADRYGDLLAWRARLRRTMVPPAAEALHTATARYADRPIEKVEVFAEELLEQCELHVAELRDGKPPSGAIVVSLTLTVDDEVQQAIERELSRLATAAQHSRQPVAHPPAAAGPRGGVVRRTRAESPRSEGHSPSEALARGVALRAGAFAAIDFETATRSRASACSVGVAIVREGRVEAVETWLIRPPGNEYEAMNVHIHGIAPELTSDRPSFIEVWPEVLARLGSLPVVAHNAPFDLSVIRACLAAAGAGPISLRSVCTCMLARRAWPGWPSYRLNVVADACGISFEHHRAGEDAAAAAKLGVAVCGATGEPSILGAAGALGVRVAGTV